MSEAKFKVGDKVRLQKNTRLFNIPDKFYEIDLEVSEPLNGWVKIKEYDLEFPLSVTRFYHSCFELVEETPIKVNLDKISTTECISCGKTINLESPIDSTEQIICKSCNKAKQFEEKPKVETTILAETSNKDAEMFKICSEMVKELDQSFTKNQIDKINEMIQENYNKILTSTIQTTTFKCSCGNKIEFIQTGSNLFPITCLSCGIVYKIINGKAPGFIERKKSEWIPPTFEQAAESLRNSAVSQRMDYLKEDPKPLDTYHGEGWAVTPDLSFVLPSKLKVDKEVFNIFRTKESAEQARKHLQITCALLNFRAENDKDYNDKDYFGYFINLKSQDIDRFHPNFNPAGAVVFSSEKLAQSALDMLKRKGLI